MIDYVLDRLCVVMLFLVLALSVRATWRMHQLATLVENTCGVRP